jgi:hypothetical protein
MQSEINTNRDGNAFGACVPPWTMPDCSGHVCFHARSKGSSGARGSRGSFARPRHARVETDVDAPPVGGVVQLLVFKERVVGRHPVTKKKRKVFITK